MHFIPPVLGLFFASLLCFVSNKKFKKLQTARQVVYLKMSKSSSSSAKQHGFLRRLEESLVEKNGKQVEQIDCVIQAIYKLSFNHHLKRNGLSLSNLDKSNQMAHFRQLHAWPSQSRFVFSLAQMRDAYATLGRNKLAPQFMSERQITESQKRNKLKREFWSLLGEAPTAAESFHLLSQDQKTSAEELQRLRTLARAFRLVLFQKKITQYKETGNFLALLRSANRELAREAFQNCIGLVPFPEDFLGEEDDDETAAGEIDDSEQVEEKSDSDEEKSDSDDDKEPDIGGEDKQEEEEKDIIETTDDGRQDINDDQEDEEELREDEKDLQDDKRQKVKLDDEDKEMEDDVQYDDEDTQDDVQDDDEDTQDDESEQTDVEDKRKKAITNRQLRLDLQQCKEKNQLLLSALATAIDELRNVKLKAQDISKAIESVLRRLQQTCLPEEEEKEGNENKLGRGFKTAQNSTGTSSIYDEASNVGQRSGGKIEKQDTNRQETLIQLL